jgi:hypothetical protein
MAGKSSNDDDSDGSENKTKNKLKIKAHDLEVKMESNEDMEKMVEMGSEEMDNIMRASMRGELEVLEEENATFLIGGH